MLLRHLLIFWLCCLPLSASADDRAVLATMLDNFLAGVEQAQVHDAFWAEDLVYTSSRGTRTNKAGIMASFDTPAQEGGASGPEYTAENVDIRVYGETAVVAFTLVAHSGTETSYYLNTGTFLKRQGVWQVVAWQATVKE